MLDGQTFSCLTGKTSGLPIIESSMAVSKSTCANYGIDAPSVVRNLTIAGIACMAAGLALKPLLAATQPKISALLLICGLVAGCCLLFTAGLMVWSSKVGKLFFREKLLGSFILRGDETFLDIGCGRGLLLNAAARREGYRVEGLSA